MNYIGEKIKELRRSRDMTQEKLAEFLSVSYQTVSKWECGVSSPDVYMIAPLARLFGITTDELLGVENGDARRAEFDRAYDRYWQKDIPEMYRYAKEAVAEFPGEMKYLEFLASMEFYIAFDDEYRTGKSDAYFISMMEKSVQHYKTVIENVSDGKIKDKAIVGIVMSLKQLGRTEEAKHYAELVPKEAGKTRDEVLSYCLTGKELFDVFQRMLYESVKKSLGIISDMYFYKDPENPIVPGLLDASEAFIRAAVPVGEELGFCYYLYQIYLKRAECAVSGGLYDDAVGYLKTAKAYALGMDSLYNTGSHRYRGPLFDGYEDAWNVEEGCLHDSEDCWKWKVASKAFDPIRDREDFRELLSQ